MIKYEKYVSKFTTREKLSKELTKIQKKMDKIKTYDWTIKRATLWRKKCWLLDLYERNFKARDEYLKRTGENVPPLICP